MLHLPHWLCTADCQKVLVYQASRPPASVEPPATSDHLCTPEEEKRKKCTVTLVQWNPDERPVWWEISLLKPLFFFWSLSLKPRSSNTLSLEIMSQISSLQIVQVCVCVCACMRACVPACMRACVCGCCWPVFQCASFVFVFSKLSFLDYVWFQLSVYCNAVMFLMTWGCLLKILFICC